MNAMFSNSDKKSKKITSNPAVNKTMRDYSKEQYFIEKAEASKKVIEKYGLPKSLVPDKK